MRDRSSASNLAIVERKEPRRKPGGCAGIFFQLFDWKKKKHFSSRLLPPVSAAKRVLRKFGGHEKLPVAKHLLIPQENGGGLSAVKRSASSTSCSSLYKPVKGMGAPSLVGRLMGLESMPIVHHGNPRNARGSKCENVRNKSSDLEQDEWQRVGSRPPELNTGRLLKSRRPVNSGRFGSDTMQFDMTVEQQRKLASFVKSQSMSSRKKKARLVGVATKILEPGLQSRNRAKFAITNVGTSLNNAEGSDDAPSFLSNKPDEPLHYDFRAGSCLNCGNLVEVMDLRSSELDYRYSSLDSNDGSSFPFDVLEDNKLERRVMQSSEKRVGRHPFEGEDTKRSSLIMANSGSRGASSAVRSRERECRMRNDQDRRRTNENVASKFALSQNRLRQNQLPPANEKFVSGSKEHGQRHSAGDLNPMHRAKKFSASNKSSDNRTLMTCSGRPSQKNVMKLGKSDLHKDNMAPKGRPISNYHNVSGQMSDGALMKQTNCRKKELTPYKISGSVDICPKNRRIISEATEEVEASNGNRKENSTISPTFSSGMKHISRSTSCHKIVERSECLDEFTGCTSFPKELVSDAETENLSSQNEKYVLSKMEEDALFSHLEDKVKDLSHCEKDNLQTDNDFPVISDLLIIERMISTLLNRGSSFQKNSDSSQSLCSPQKIQDEEKSGKHLVYSDSHDLCSSPIMSTFEASFSSDTCYCWKPNHRSGGSCNKIQDREQENDDPTPPVDMSDFHIDKLPTNTGNEPIMHNRHPDEARLKKTKFSNSAEAISNAELSFESAGKIHTVVDMLETLRNSLRNGEKCSAGYEVDEQENQLRKLLLDCIMECLGSLCSCLYHTDCKASFRLQLFLSKKGLAEVVAEEIIRWHRMAGKSLGELIEQDIGHAKMDWPAFKIGGLFELSEQIEDETIELLISELVVVDLCQYC